MNVGHLKPHQITPSGFFVHGTHEVQGKHGTEVEWFCRIRLPVYGMAFHDYQYMQCFSQRELWFFGRRGFWLSWRPVPGAEWIRNERFR